MSTPPQDPRGDAPEPRPDDRTRDIRLPSLPDRPPSTVRPEWHSHIPQSAADMPPSEAEQSGPVDAAVPPASPARSADPAPPRPYVLPDELTDEMSSPPQGRQPTLAFDVPPEGASAPVAPPDPAAWQGSVPAAPAPSWPPPFAPPAHGAPSYGPPGRGPARAPERNRRWPWVVLTVLPILVIIGAGLMLLFLLGGR